MGWRFFGLLNVLIAMVAICGPVPHHNVLAGIATIMTVPAAGGVLLYANGSPTGPRLWRVFSWLYAANAVGFVTFLVIRSIEIAPRHNPVLLVVVMASIVACHYFTWLALHRLGRERYQPAQRRRPVAFIRRLLVSTPPPHIPGSIGAFRDPRWQAILICSMSPGPLVYALWGRLIGPYYAVTGGLIGGAIGLAYLLWQVRIVVSGDMPKGGSEGD